MNFVKLIFHEVYINASVYNYARCGINSERDIYARNYNKKSQYFVSIQFLSPQLLIIYILFNKRIIMLTLDSFSRACTDALARTSQEEEDITSRRPFCLR